MKKTKKTRRMKKKNLKKNKVITLDIEEPEVNINEDQLFSQTKRKYQADIEADLCFPHKKREYDAVFCLEDIKEEFSNYEKGKPLKDIYKKLIGINFEGDEDFFKEDVEGWSDVD